MNTRDSIVKSLRGLYRYNIHFRENSNHGSCDKADGRVTLSEDASEVIHIYYAGLGGVFTSAVGMRICEALGRAGVNYIWNRNTTSSIRVPI